MPADPVDAVIDLMAARKLKAVPARPPDDAFDHAVEAFHAAYHRAWQAHPPLDRGEQAHDEATREALEAFLGAYIERVTR